MLLVSVCSNLVGSGGNFQFVETPASWGSVFQPCTEGTINASVARCVFVSCVPLSPKHTVDQYAGKKCVASAFVRLSQRRVLAKLDRDTIRSDLRGVPHDAKGLLWTSAREF